MSPGPHAGRVRGPRGDGGPGGEGGFGLVEALVSAVILSVGLLAVGGLALSVAGQTRLASIRTGQAMAGQQVLEDLVTRDYPAIVAVGGDTTVTVGGRTYTVGRAVTEISAGYARVEIAVEGAGALGPDTVVTFVHEQREL